MQKISESDYVMQAHYWYFTYFFNDQNIKLFDYFLWIYASHFSNFAYLINDDAMIYRWLTHHLSCTIPSQAPELHEHKEDSIAVGLNQISFLLSLLMH